MADLSSIQCRICFEEVEDRATLIVPCRCSGSSKYVHRDCLEQWRVMDLESPNYSRCNTCRHVYELEPDETAAARKVEQDAKVRRTMYWEYFVIVLVVVVICLLGALLYYMYNERTNMQSPLWATLLMGCIVGFAILGLMSLCALGQDSVKVSISTLQLVILTILPHVSLSLLCLFGAWRFWRRASERCSEKRLALYWRLRSSEVQSVDRVVDYGEAGPSSIED